MGLKLVQVFVPSQSWSVVPDGAALSIYDIPEGARATFEWVRLHGDGAMEVCLSVCDEEPEPTFDLVIV